MGCPAALPSATLELMKTFAPYDLKVAPATVDLRILQPQRCPLCQFGAMDVITGNAVISIAKGGEQNGSLGNVLERSAELAKRHCRASICVVDDDPAVCTALLALFSAGGVNVMGFSHPQKFLEHRRPIDAEACLVVSLECAGLDDDDLKNRIREKHVCPIIYISQHGDIPSAVRAIREGAVDFLTKPIADIELLGSIALALDRDAAIRARNSEIAALQRRFSTLSPRERQVLPLIIGGMRNKQAAAVLGISEVTLQVHRSQLMHKTAARSFAELIRMSLALGVAPLPVNSRLGGGP
jgi:FixJ family two-component response regulator